MSEWISVKDRLPEEETDVLALCRDRKCFVGYICKPRWNGKINWVIWTAMKSTRDCKQKGYPLDVFTGSAGGGCKMIHALKIDPIYFDEVRNGNKRFELRNNDRDFHVGDYLALNEWDDDVYTGRTDL